MFAMKMTQAVMRQSSNYIRLFIANPYSVSLDRFHTVGTDIVEAAFSYLLLLRRIQLFDRPAIARSENLSRQRRCTWTLPVLRIDGGRHVYASLFYASLSN
jgi:hypothetical protein